MHKEIIICTFIIVSVVIVNVITQNYTQKSVEVMDEKLSILEESIRKDEPDEEKAKEKMDEVMTTWKERYEVLAFFIEHDELEKVETELTDLKAQIGVQQYEEAVSNLEKSIFILNHIKEKFRLNMKNIFYYKVYKIY